MNDEFSQFELRITVLIIPNLVEPRIEAEQRGITALSAFKDHGGTWEYAHPVYTGFVDLEKAYEIMWEFLQEYGERGLDLGVI